MFKLPVNAKPMRAMTNKLFNSKCFKMHCIGEELEKTRLIPLPSIKEDMKMCKSCIKITNKCNRKKTQHKLKK